MHGPIKLASSALRRIGRLLCAGGGGGECRHIHAAAASLAGGDVGWDHSVAKNEISDQMWADVFIHVAQL